MYNVEITNTPGIATRDAIHSYLNLAKSHLAPRSLQTYRRNLMKFADFAPPTVQEITYKTIGDYSALLHTKYKKSTIVNHIVPVRIFINFSQVNGWTSLSWKFIKPPKVEEYLAPVMEEEDFALIDGLLDENTYKDLMKKSILHLLWNTGMRVGELLSLKLSKIQSHKRQTRIHTEKNNQWRMVAWSPEAHRIFQRFLVLRICLDNERDEIFVTPPYSRVKKGALTSRSVQRWFEEWSQIIGKKLTPHSCRHGKAHYMLHRGASIENVRQILGHKIQESSLKYARMNETENMRIAEPYLQYDKKIGINQAM